MAFSHAKLTESAYLVTKAPSELYDGVPSASPITLTGSAPSVSFRCRVTVTSVTGHTDCAGSLTIGSEPAHTFSASGQKWITTTLLSAKPTVSYSGLDCNILIECIDAGGNPIQAETLTAIDIKFTDEREYYSQAIGGFTKRPAQCVTDETASQVNDIIRYNSTDYIIKAIHAKRDRLGIERRRVLQF